MMSPYYGLYLVLGVVFRVVKVIAGLLKLDLVLRALEAKFGNIILGLNDSRPKEDAPQDSVRKSEIDNLAKMVSFWWDKKGPIEVLHIYNHVRLPLVVEGLAETGRVSRANITRPDSLKGVRILDAGCGGGILAEDLARLGAHVVGVDPGAEMIDLAKHHLETESSELKDRIEYHATTVEQHANAFAGTYDAVVCSEVMEHVDEKASILEACVRCLKPGGSIFITTENRTMLAWFMFIVVAEYIARFIPKGTHFYEKFVSPGEISSILDRYRCKTRRVRGIFYDRWVNAWSFIDSDECNYGLHAVKE